MFFETRVSKGMKVGALATIGERHRLMPSMLKSPILTNEVWILHLLYTFFKDRRSLYRLFWSEFLQQLKAGFKLGETPNPESTDVFYYTRAWIFNFRKHLVSFACNEVIKDLRIP